MNWVETKTGDLMQVREFEEQNVTYGLISIKLKDQFSNLTDAVQVLLRFMQQLQPIFAIQHTTGASVERCLSGSNTTVVEYWQDIEKLDWKVKGLTDGASIAILYIKNIGNISVEKEAHFFNASFIANA